MEIFFFVSLGFILIYSWRKNDDLFHPLTITVFIWLAITGGYNILTLTMPNYSKLSSNYYIYVFIFIVTFALTQEAINHIKVNIKSHSEQFYLPVNMINNLLIIASVVDIIYIVLLFKYSGTTNLLSAIYNLRRLFSDSTRSFSTSLTVFTFLFNFTPVLLCYAMWFKLCASKKLEMVLLIEMFIASLLLTTKGRLLRFIVFIVILLRRNLSKGKGRIAIIIIIVAGGFLLNTMITNRDTTFFERHTFTDYLFLYIFSSLPALDELIHNELFFSSSAFGARTFRFIYAVGAKIGLNSMPTFVDPEYILVPAQRSQMSTNVTTVIGPYYMDFNFWGFIVCGIIYGLIFGISYRMAKKYNRPEFRVFYLLNIPYLFFQTFGDFIIPTFSITLQEFICAFLIFKLENKNIVIRYKS